MIDNDSEPLDDDRILALCYYGLDKAVGFSDSKIANERVKVLRYYNQERPAPAHKGDSEFRSLDVYDSVESMTAQLLEAFTGNARPVKFNPGPGEDDDVAQQKTELTTYSIFKENPGFQILQTVIKDGLLGRAGVVKHWWENSVKTDYYTMSNASQEEVAAFLQKSGETAEITDCSFHDDGVTFKRVRISVKTDRSQVRIKALPPEQFLISPAAEDIQTAELVAHRQYKTMSELLKAGYPKDKVMALQDQDRLWVAMEPELMVRHEQTDDLFGEHALEGGQFAKRTCIVYECYTQLDIDGSGEAQDYKVTIVGNNILDKEPVDRRPFDAFVPLPRPHAFWGTNYAATIIPTQVASTYLTRSIINHALVTNNPRLQVVRGAVLNPRELMENRIGGIVNVTRPDGIIPLQQAGLNPYVFQTLQLLQQRKEETTGISQLSQGLNKDAISKQNSQGMVQDLINVSQTRQKVVARNFAEVFLSGLYTSVFKLIVENEDRQKMLRISGSQWTPVDVTQWSPECTLDVSFALGYGENEKEAQKWAGYHKMMVEDPILQKMYGPQQAYNVLKKGTEAIGIRDLQNYALTPAQIPPAQPSPMEVADLQVKQADAKVKQANAEAAVRKLQLDQVSQQQEATDRMAKVNLETRKVDTQLQLEQDKLAHKIVVDAAEIALQKEANAVAKMTAVAQPTRS